MSNNKKSSDTKCRNSKTSKTLKQSFSTKFFLVLYRLEQAMVRSQVLLLGQAKRGGGTSAAARTGWGQALRPHVQLCMYTIYMSSLYKVDRNFFLAIL